MLWQPSLPDRYLDTTPEELAQTISVRREQLGESLVILGHHYQTDEVIQHADFTGDSLKLSQLAAGVTQTQDVKYVVFCGVHFMAETADLLTPESVEVILPDLSAGCSMADMADYDDAIDAWDAMEAALGDWKGRVIPITYVNSTAAIKAFVGSRGGACCTSSNAKSVFDWALRGGTIQNDDEIKILFLPDQHLGRNTAASFGIDVARHAPLYEPKRAQRGETLGGMTEAQLREAKVILWAGHCSVHKLFRPEHCDQARAADAASPDRPPQTILVHPECAKEVVDKSDLSGSTEFIIKTIEAAEPGSRWLVGTEVHLVNRLAKAAAERGVEVAMLSDCQCLCTTMYRIDQAHLLWVLDHLVGKFGGKPQTVNRVAVHPDAREPALLAVERMLGESAAMASS